MSARAVRTLKVARSNARCPGRRTTVVPTAVGAASAARLGEATRAKVVAAAAASARSGVDRMGR